LDVWRFAKIQVENKTQEAIKLVYADNDIVYVSIHSLHKISKYTGKDGHRLKFKLGSNAWKVLKQKNQGRVKHIAFNLIQLYAKGDWIKFQFAPDSYLQNELESSFIYEDTPDQTKSTQEVKPIWKAIALWIDWFVVM
jgi:transcription-repair coupling factor (superfamily II helicase)